MLPFVQAASGQVHGHRCTSSWRHASEKLNLVLLAVVSSCSAIMVVFHTLACCVSCAGLAGVCMDQLLVDLGNMQVL